MKELFFGKFTLNNYDVTQNKPAQTQDNKKQNEEPVFNFRAKDRFTESFKKNEVESEYSLLSRAQKNSEKAKQLEAEMEYIKSMEIKNRDYFNF